MQVVGLGEFDSRGRVLTMRLRISGGTCLSANAMCQGRPPFLPTIALHLLENRDHDQKEKEEAPGIVR